MGLKTFVEQFERQVSSLKIGREGTSVQKSPATRDGVPFSVDYLWRLALAGRIFIYGDADQNDTVAGQTSFANTTPTFLLDVPPGVVAVPLYLDLSQTGTVAGGDIELVIEYDIIKRYASAGTSEKALCTLTATRETPQSDFYSGATAVAGYGMRIFSADIAADVSPAEGILPGPLWTPVVPIILKGPAALLVFTSAATTAPTWLWSFCIAELPEGWI